MLGLPWWWFHGLESTCQCRGYRSDPWSWKIPNVVGQLSPCITATEARTPRAHALQQKKTPQWEAHTRQPENSPHSPKLEKAGTQQQRSSAAKDKQTNKQKLIKKNYYVTIDENSQLIKFWWAPPCSQSHPNFSFFLYFALKYVAVLMQCLSTPRCSEISGFCFSFFRYLPPSPRRIYLPSHVGCACQ